MIICFIHIFDENSKTINKMYTPIHRNGHDNTVVVLFYE
ncbi:hypothetical protein M082_5997 [Bacteroides fragilis str. 3725 D9 ii]|nr:hypothetical protein M082_5997 [Bacteroides fragilis str. 3725 D9 ii]